MSTRYHYDHAGTGHWPASTAARQRDRQTLTHAAGNQPFATSAGAGFPASATPKKSYCVSPDGRSRTWTTIGQDRSGPQHPFLRRTFQFTAPNGLTTVRTLEIHWTITPSKDGKHRHVRYETTQDDHVYDRSGRELAPHRKQSFKGAFENDGNKLPFEEPQRCAWPRDTHQRDDAQARAREQERWALPKNNAAARPGKLPSHNIATRKPGA